MTAEEIRKRNNYLSDIQFSLSIASLESLELIRGAANGATRKDLKAVMSKLVGAGAEADTSMQLVLEATQLVLEAAQRIEAL